MIDKWAELIEQYEGFKVGYTILGKKIGGSTSWRNNNSGNLRSSPYASSIKNGFACFDSYAVGLKALCYQLKIVCNGTSPVYSAKAKLLGLKDSSQLTLLQFQQIYSPPSDSNNPLAYATFIANGLGINLDTKISTLL